MKIWKNLLISVPVGILISYLTGILQVSCKDITPPCPPNTLCNMALILECGFPVRFLQSTDLTYIIWWKFILNSLFWIAIIVLIIWFISYLIKRKKTTDDTPPAPTML